MPVTHKPAITYMQVVDDRKAVTPLPIIQRVANPDSIFH